MATATSQPADSRLAAMVTMAQVTRERLLTALQEVESAIAAGEEGHRNLLVGCILDVQTNLDTAKVLVDAIVRLQREGK